MKYFDLHCDTAEDLYRKKTDFSDTSEQVNREGFSVFEKSIQCFAVFSDDEECKNGIEFYKNTADYFLKIIQKEKNVLPIMTTEGGHIIEGDLANLDILKSYGVRIFGFAWNGENALAAGNLRDPSRHLTALGLKALKRIEELNIYPDVSHLSDAGVKDILTHASRPVISTHSNCRSVCDHPRNHTDEQLREIFATGGLVGLNLYTDTLSDNPSVDDILRHLDKMLDNGGENGACLGCDWDGMTPPHGITGIKDIPIIYDKIEKSFSTDIAQRVVWKNACRFFGIEE